ncbi:MAG: hypothetical protein JWQ49_4935 [Edaphobacter sp.]|jgi:hypothetical protein|nr:hypothetical protein [Edaphobacter sp.]
MSATANIANVANIHKTHKTHEILVELDQENNYVVAHFPGPLKLGETVRCHTDTVGGVVEIYFNVNGSPFLNLDGSAKTEIDSNDLPLELKLPGNFIGRCYMTTPDGVVHTYNHTLPWIAGGNMVVK